MSRIRLLLPALLALLCTGYLGLGVVLYNGLSRIGDSCATSGANRPDHFGCYSDCEGWDDFDFDAYSMSNYEAVEFKSRDGLALSGWFIEADPAAPVVIVVHGYQVCKYYHDPLAQAGALHRIGFNVLLFDQRDSGDSEIEDGRTAYGSEEYLDALGAFDYLRQRGFDDAAIGMHGSSLGGAIALIAFSQEPRLQALFLDSPLTDGKGQFTEFTGLPGLLFPAVQLAAYVISGDDLLRYDPLDGIRRADGRGVMAVHGTGDQIVQSRHTQLLAQVAAEEGVDLEVWMPEGVGHVRALAADPQGYESRMAAFFQQHLRR